MSYKDYISEDGYYIIPVSWEVYSTIKVKADNLEEAVKKAENNIENLKLGENEYIDGSYQLDTENLIDAQEYADIGGIVIE